MKITVIGIGQSMRGDDAAGIAAVRRWQEAYPATASRSDISVQASELPGLGLLDMLEGFDAALIVDAVESTAMPGTIYHLGPEDLSSFTVAAKSAHGWGVAETLQLGRKVSPDTEPVRIRILGIVAASMELGQPLSGAVDAALPAVCEAIESEVQRLLAAE